MHSAVDAETRENTRVQSRTLTAMLPFRASARAVTPASVIPPRGGGGGRGGATAHGGGVQKGHTPTQQWPREYKQHGAHVFVVHFFSLSLPPLCGGLL